MIYTANTAAAKTDTDAKAPVAASVPFIRAALKATQAAPAQSAVIGTAVQNVSFVLPAVGGWNRRISLQCVCTTAGNSAAVAYNADAPTNAITQILLKDASQRQLAYFPSGYHLAQVNNFGGYTQFPHTGSARCYTAVTSTGATGGSFSFVLDIPQECGRDGFASYPNMDASQRLTLDLVVNTTAQIYSTGPTAAGTLVITPVVEYYTKPAAVNALGQAQDTQPPAAGSVQYWRSQTYTLATGDNIITTTLSGRYLRNIFALFTTAADVRSDAVRGTILRVELDNSVLYDGPINTIDSRVYRAFGLDTVTGFLPVHIGTLDPDGSPGSEWGDSWLPSSTASQLVTKITTGAVGKLFLALNEIELAGSYLR